MVKPICVGGKGLSYTISFTRYTNYPKAAFRELKPQKKRTQNSSGSSRIKCITSKNESLGNTHPNIFS